MRFHLASLSILLLVAAAANGNNITLPNHVNAQSFLEIMNMHFQHSMDYLYTSKQYGSQYIERPGMAKLLMDASDFEWEQGIDFLKKFLQREGRLNDFRANLDLASSGQLTMSENNAHKFEKYFGTLAILIDDAETIFGKMNAAHAGSSNATRFVDHEIAHYLDDKLEKKAERIYELKTHQTTLGQMQSLGIAVDAFDASL